MSEKTLRDMLAYASDLCEVTFDETGAIEPLWHAVTATGESFIEPAPDDVDTDDTRAIISTLFDLHDVVRYFLVYEAWTIPRMVSSDEMDRINRDGLAVHPERVEVVLIQGEDQVCGQIVAQRRIIRPADRKPYLGPLETIDTLIPAPADGGVEFQGDAVGLLPARGTRH